MDGREDPRAGQDHRHRQGPRRQLRRLIAAFSGAHGGTFEGEVDGIIAAAHTALALQALGLGVFFNGLVTGAVEMDGTVTRLLGVPDGHEVHAAFTFGYPRVTYSRSIRRAFAATRVVE